MQRFRQLADALRELGAVDVAVTDPAHAITVPADSDIVVVATPLDDTASLTALRADLVVVECRLATQPTPLAGLVAASGGCFVDGLEVRATQAAIDFRSLMGAEADADLLREALDEFLSA